MKASMSFGRMETRSCSLRMPGPGRGLQPRSGHSRLHCACPRAGTWHRGSRCTRAGVKARPESAKGGTLLQPLRWTEHFLQDDGALQITAPEQPPACTSATLQGLDLGSVVDLRVELRVPAYRRWRRLRGRAALLRLRCTVAVALTNAPLRGLAPFTLTTFRFRATAPLVLGALGGDPVVCGKLRVDVRFHVHVGLVV